MKGMTIIEGDLFAALKELLEAAQLMASGEPTVADTERYERAVQWSKRVISLAERTGTA